VEEITEELSLRNLKLFTVEKTDWALSFYTKLCHRLAEKIQRAWGFDVYLEIELRVSLRFTLEMSMHLGYQLKQSAQLMLSFDAQPNVTKFLVRTIEA
jgi:hypothetical protein